MVSAHTRILAIDPGKVRIGLAISDPERRLASPLTIYTRRNDELDAKFFRELAAEEEIGCRHRTKQGGSS